MTFSPPAALNDVWFRRGDHEILRGINWQINRGEHWVVLGANGSGKTTLSRILALADHPSEGTVEILGERLGSTDVRTLRQRIGFVSAAFAEMLRPQLQAVDIVMCAKNAALEPWWHTYNDNDRQRAVELLDEAGLSDRAFDTFGTLSSGERQRVLLARLRMTAPELIIVDEPNAGLDLAGRESLVESFDGLCSQPQAPPVILVTHHVEEIAPAFTHLLAIRDGAVIDAGPIAATLTSELLSETYGLALTVGEDGGRWWARRAG